MSSRQETFAHWLKWKLCQPTVNTEINSSDHHPSGEMGKDFLRDWILKRLAQTGRHSLRTPAALQNNNIKNTIIVSKTQGYETEIINFLPCLSCSKRSKPSVVLTSVSQFEKENKTLLSSKRDSNSVNLSTG